MNATINKRQFSIAAVAATFILGAVTYGDQTGDAATGHPTTAAQTRAAGPPIIPLPPPRAFVRTVDNPYSPFVPGMRWVYGGGSASERERIVVKVVERAKRIEGIEATVVRDTAWVNGELAEDTFDWYAQDRRGRVWYLGEDTKTYEDGQVVSIEGSWQAGVDGAKPGIVMFAHPQLGKPYRQEFYAGHAEDQAKFLTLNTQAATQAGLFRHVRMTEDSTPLDPDVTELKFYAPGVGIVQEFDLAPEAGRTQLLHFHEPT